MEHSMKTNDLLQQLPEKQHSATVQSQPTRTIIHTKNGGISDV